MPRNAKPLANRRSEPVKTGVRPVEKALLQEIADEWNVTPSEVAYVAVLRLLKTERPEAGIPSPILVG